MEFLDTSFLQNDEIKLVLDKFYPGNLSINWVPAYSFYICDLKGNKIGKCDLRIGHSESLYYGGNIGYTIYEEYRLSLCPILKSHFPILFPFKSHI